MIKERERRMKCLTLKDYENLEAKNVIQYFIEISKIPRRSGEEKKIREYLENFAKERNLKYIKDAYENIIMYKPATKGRESEETLAFQAHTDMICEKDIGVQHDFSKDPIVLYKEDDNITAKGTTLGADNGIGVAYMLAILDSDISTPNLECIFTVQEETTMIGAIKIDEKNIKARKIISLDNGKEGKILISSANCNEWIGRLEANKETIKTKEIYKLQYANFLGGHSGGNIGDERRGNPIKLAMKVLKEVDNIQIVKLQGGSRVNVIPREFEVEFCIRNSSKEQQEVAFNQMLEAIQRQKGRFHNETIILEKLTVDKTIQAYSIKTSRRLIDFVNQYKNGALKREKSGDVILSSNLAVLKEYDKGIQIEFSERSNQKALEKQYLKEITKWIQTYQINIIWHQELKGVEKKENNALLEKCQKVYKKLYNKNMEEVISQGVVEGGFFVDKMPDCEYVCIGPNCYNVHSPRESVSISSIENVWKFLKEVVK